MLEIPFEIIKGGAPEKVRPFYSSVEKNILEFKVMTDDHRVIFDNACRLLNVPEDLPFELKLAWIYKCREVSFGSDLNLRYKCPRCSNITESLVMLEDCLEYPNFEKLPPEFKKLELSDAAKKKKVSEILEIPLTQSYAQFKNTPKPRNIAEHSRYSIALRARVPNLKRCLDSKCFICGAIKQIRIDSIRFCLDTLSEHTPTTMLQTYNFLAMNGFGKLDVDSMLPYEREIHLKLIENRVKETKPKK